MTPVMARSRSARCQDAVVHFAFEGVFEIGDQALRLSRELLAIPARGDGDVPITCHRDDGDPAVLSCADAVQLALGSHLGMFGLRVGRHQEHE